MKKVLILFLILAALLCGCAEKKKPITEEKAVQIVLEALNVPETELGGIHIHTGDYKNEDCYLIYVTVSGTNKLYVVAQDDGEIIHVGNSDHSH